MITELMTKKLFLEFMDKLIGKNEVVIFTNRLGEIKVLSEKKKDYAKSYSAIYPNNIFKEERSIKDLISSKLTGLIICNSSILNKELQKEFKEIRKTENVKLKASKEKKNDL